MSEQEFLSASHPLNLMSAAVDDGIAGGQTLADIFSRIKQLAIESIKNGGFSEDAIIAWLEKVWAEKVVPRKWTNRPILEGMIENALLLSLKTLIHSAL